MRGYSTEMFAKLFREWDPTEDVEPIRATYDMMYYWTECGNANMEEQILLLSHNARVDLLVFMIDEIWFDDCSGNKSIINKLLKVIVRSLKK